MIWTSWTGRQFPLGLAGEVECGCGACRVELSEPAHSLAGGQRLHSHATLLELLDRVGVGPHPAVGTGPHDELGRKLIQDLAKVVDHQRVPSCRHHFRTTGWAG